MKNILKFCIPAFLSLLYSWHSPGLFAACDPSDPGVCDTVFVNRAGATGPIRFNASEWSLSAFDCFADGTSPDTVLFGAVKFAGPPCPLPVPSNPAELIFFKMDFVTVVPGTFCIATILPPGPANVFQTELGASFSPQFKSFPVTAPGPAGTIFSVPVEILNDEPLCGITLSFEIETCGPGFARFLGCKPDTCVPAPGNLVGWWPGDGHTYDISGNNNHGVFQGTQLYGSPGKVGPSFDFNGIDGYVEVPDNPLLDLDPYPGGELSIDAWIKANSVSGFQSIVSKNDFIPLDTGTYGYIFYLNDGHLGFRLADLNHAPVECLSASILAVGTWYHVAVTLNRDNAQGLKLYVDGLDVTPLGGCDPTSVTGGVANNANFLISGSSLFDGLIDEVELFNRELDPLEVYTIWAADSQGKCKPAGGCIARPGDANASGTYTLADVIATVNYIFNKPGCTPQPLCWLSGLLCRGDWNGSGTVSLVDVIQAVNYIFNKPGGPWNAVPVGVCCLP